MNHTSSRNSSWESPLKEAHRDAFVLTVDDDDGMRCWHDAVLSRAGYRSMAAADGEEALRLLATHHFDLVITDYEMPHLDGVGLVRALRAKGSRVPIIMISGSMACNLELPSDIRREVAVTLPKPTDTFRLLAGVVFALESPAHAPGRTHISDIFPKAKRLPGKVRLPADLAGVD